MAIALAHEGDLYQGMGIALKLTSAGQHRVDQVAHQPRVRFRAVPVVNASQIPRQPRHLALANILHHQAWVGSVFPVDVYELRRPVHRGRNERDRAVALRLYLQIVTHHEHHVGLFEGRKDGLIPNAEIGTVRIFPELDGRSDFKLRSGGGSDDQVSTAAHEGFQGFWPAPGQITRSASRFPSQSRFSTAANGMCCSVSNRKSPRYESCAMEKPTPP